MVCGLKTDLGMHLCDRRMLCDECVRTHYQATLYRTTRAPYDTPVTEPTELPKLYCSRWELRSSAFGETHVALIWSCSVFVPRPGGEGGGE